MARLITASPKFKILVANLQGSGNPSKGLNPTKIRTGFEKQMLREIAQGTNRSEVDDPSTPGLHTQQGLLTYSGVVPVRSSGTVTVADNDFSDAATLSIGQYDVTSGEDFTVGVDTLATAIVIAAAIGSLPGFDAVAVGAVVTVTGLSGPAGNDILFSATYRGSVQNYTLNPDDGFFDGAEPFVGPPTILY